jgi:electron transfer flavoprotein beta subunit
MLLDVKIVVPVKQAATPDEDFELRADGRAVDEDSIEWDLNEWDMFSIEAALELRDAAGDGEVVVVSVGGDEVGDGLLTCLAMGADRSVHIEADGRELDALAVARLLRDVVAHELPDLVLCGVQSSDDATGATGVALAALLDLPRVAVVRRIELETDGASATVDRELEGGTIERLRVPLPALLTVQTGINEPRYASLRGIRQAKAKPAQTLEPAAVASGSRVVTLERPPKASSAELLEGSAEAVAEQIAAIIQRTVG